jgi:hypothetical protein
MASDPFTRFIPRQEEDGTFTFVSLRNGFAVPRHFIAEGDPVSIEVEVETDGTGYCRALEVRPRGKGAAVTSESLRISVPKLTKQAVALAARLYPPNEGFKFVSTPPDAAAAFYEDYTKDARRPRRGSPLTDSNLRQVADLYRAALKRGDPPTQTVADELHVARSTAARWVTKARERNLLGPSLRGRAGEREEGS